MDTAREVVREHYAAGIPDRAALLARLAEAVDQIAPPITAAKLARIDQFHLGGLAATAELARLAELQPGTRVLDAGSGLGGPARYLAETFDCRVTGVDLSPDYVAVATALTGRVGLADRSLLYAELRRVLRQGGRLAFYDPVAGEEGAAPIFPVPWAATQATSTLLTAAQTGEALEAAGFAPISLADVSEHAMQWAAAHRSAPADAATLALVVGPRMTEMAGNFARSLREGRVRLAMGLFRAA